VSFDRQQPQIIISRLKAMLATISQHEPTQSKCCNIPEHLARYSSIIPPAVGIAEKPLASTRDTALVGGAGPLLKGLRLRGGRGQGQANRQEEGREGELHVYGVL
jgi:hypothetical protein